MPRHVSNEHSPTACVQSMHRNSGVLVDGLLFNNHIRNMVTRASVTVRMNAGCAGKTVIP